MIQTETEGWIPLWMTSREAFAAYVADKAYEFKHWTLYHSIRLPWYALKLWAYSPRGVAICLRHWGRFVWDSESSGIVAAANEGSRKRARGGVNGNEAYKRRDQHRRNRLIGSLLALAVLAGVVAYSWTVEPSYVILGALIGLLEMGNIGRPKSKPFTGRSPNSNKLDFDALVRVFREGPHPQLRKVLDEDPERLVVFPSRSVAAGTSHAIELPANVRGTVAAGWSTQIAAGLGMTQDSMTMVPGGPDEPANRVHLVQFSRAARLDFGPRDLPTGVDIFAGYRIGQTLLGEQVTLAPMWNNQVVIGAQGSGKSYALQLMVGTEADDAKVSHIGIDLKGMGDLAPMRDIAVAYVEGESAADLDTAMEILRWLRHSELQARKATIKGLPAKYRPENKITAAMASSAQLEMPILRVYIDEFFVLLGKSSPHRAEATDLIQHLLKQARAAGIGFVLSGHRVQKDDLPSGLGEFLGQRIMLRHTDEYVARWMLGAGCAKKGLVPGDISEEDPGRAYVMTGGAAQLVQLDQVTPEAFSARMAEQQVVRGDAGRLLGQADPAAVARASNVTDIDAGMSPLDMVVAVWPKVADEPVAAVPSAVVLDLVTNRFPGVFPDGFRNSDLSALLNDRWDIVSGNVSWEGKKPKGYRWTDVTDAHQKGA